MSTNSDSGTRGPVGAILDLGEIVIWRRVLLLWPVLFVALHLSIDPLSMSPYGNKVCDFFGPDPELVARDGRPEVGRIYDAVLERNGVTAAVVTSGLAGVMSIATERLTENLRSLRRRRMAQFWAICCAPLLFFACRCVFALLFARRGGADSV